MASIQGKSATERAINRAMAEDLKPVRVAAGVFEVASVKSPGKVYTVRVLSRAEMACDCIGGKYAMCKHRAAVPMYIAAERLAAPAHQTAPLAAPANRGKSVSLRPIMHRRFATKMHHRFAAKVHRPVR